MMENKLLKGGDIAALLNISRTQAFILMKRGDIPTIRFGKLVRVRTEDLEQFIEEKRTRNNQSYLKTELPAGTGSQAQIQVSPRIKEFTHE
jgi:excisionase family DNA binding protein